MGRQAPKRMPGVRPERAQIANFHAPARRQRLSPAAGTSSTAASSLAKVRLRRLHAPDLRSRFQPGEKGDVAPNLEKIATAMANRLVGSQSYHWVRDDAEEETSESEDENERQAKQRGRVQEVQRSRRRQLRHALERMHSSTDPTQVKYSVSILEQMSVKGPTFESYLRAVQGFIAFADSEGERLVEPSEVDALAVAYMNQQFLMGMMAWHGERLLAGILFLKGTLGKMGATGLPRSWRALQGWRKCVPGVSRVPHPLALWAAMAVDLSRRGHPLMSVMLLLAFSCYLRPGDAFCLRRGDFIPPASGVTTTWTLLLYPQERLERSKAGTADNSLALDSAWLQWLSPVLAVISQGDSESSPWNFTYLEYLKQLKASAARLGVQLVPYQCRHSGVSVDRANGWRSQEACQKRGRWASIRSLVRYEQHGRLGHTIMQYSATLRAHIHLCERHLEAVVLGQPHGTISLPPVAHGNTLPNSSAGPASSANA